MLHEHVGNINSSGCARSSEFHLGKREFNGATSRVNEVDLTSIVPMEWRFRRALVPEKAF